MLVPTASIAERVIAPDDPKVALELATRLLADGRLMANHHRGLWGYSGTARGDGRALTIQSSGIGAQAALVLAELARHGAGTIVHVAGARHGGGSFAPGDLFAVRSAGGHQLDPELTSALAQLTDGDGELVTTTLHDPVGDGIVTDLETEAMAAMAHAHGVRFAALRVIVSVPGAGLDHEQTAAATVEACVLAAGVLEAV